LTEAFAETNIPADLEISTRITRWAYAQVEAANGLVWVSGETMVPLDASWRAVLEVNGRAP
jgi:hypothetical protein